VRRTGDSNREAATRLAKALGRLPLALEQAAAYVTTERLGLARYLELFEERRSELALGKPLAYQGTVDATYTLALEQLRAANPAAGQLLELCALLAPDEIPLPLLLSRPQLLPRSLAKAAADSLQRGEVVGVLYRQGLLTRDTAGTARMHRIVQAVALSNLPQADCRQRTIEAVELLAELFPTEGEDPDGWPRCAQLLAHVQAVLDHARNVQLTSQILGELLNSTGRYLMGRGLDIWLARDLFEEALAMYQRLHDGDHHNVAMSMGNLAVNMTELGEHVRARELDEQVLAMYQRLYEGDHPDVATALNNLAVDLRHEGDYARARELRGQALAMRQRLYEGDHPDVAISLNNAAVDLRDQGEYARARELDEQALGMRQRLYEGDHPDVAISLEHLSIDLTELGEYARARELDEQASAMRGQLAERQSPSSPPDQSTHQ
jgi:tetratricopeptide (TPR) repeat protein